MDDIKRRVREDTGTSRVSADQLLRNILTGDRITTPQTVKRFRPGADLGLAAAIRRPSPTSTADVLDQNRRRL